MQAANVTNVAISCVNNPAAQFSLGGSINGLPAGTFVVLKNSVTGTTQGFGANGAFAFDAVASGNSYDVIVATQPSGGICTVTNGSGTVGTANVTGITVSCNAQYSIYGSVSGLAAGNAVSLLDNGSDHVTVSANGIFTFPTQLASGAPYAVSVGTQPAHQTCTVTNGTGTVGTTNVTNVTVPCSPNPVFAFVTNAGGNNISVYSINATSGALTPVTGSPFAAGSGPSSVTVNPAGTLAFVTNSNNVSVYSINATTGALTPVTGSPFAAGTNPASVTVNPAGTLAFVANQGSNNVSVYSINATTGALTPVTGSPFAAGTAPSSVTVNPAGTLAFVANLNSNDVSVYSIDATTGALTQVTGSPFAAGSHPTSVTTSQH